MRNIFYIALFRKKGAIKNTVLSKIIDYNQSLSPNYKTIIYDDDMEAHQFIKNNYSDVHLMVFDQLLPGAYKADLLRLLLLYRYGGVYVDLGMRFEVPLKEMLGENHLVLVKDYQRAGIANGFIFARYPRSVFIRACIVQLIQNVIDLSYGASSLDITGPDMLDHVFRKLYGPCREGKHILGIKIMANAGSARITFGGKTCIHGKNNLDYSDIISKIEKQIHPKCNHYSFLYGARHIYKSLVGTGSWKTTCGRRRLGNGRLYAHLKKIDGTYRVDSFPIHFNSQKKIQYSNINGRFRRETPYTIAKNIFQTHKSMDYIKEKDSLAQATSSWRKDSTFSYQFYDDAMCDSFMKNNFGDKTYTAYRKCPLAVMKADLWRYCVVYKYGGVYADADTILKAHSPSFLIERDALLAVVPENNIHFCQWVFAAPSGSPILKKVIDLSVSRILALNQPKEHFVHESSGPGVFTDGIIMYLRETNKPIFRTDGGHRPYRYLNYLDPCLYVFDVRTFHPHKVEHLFAGQWRDGWCDKRRGLVDQAAAVLERPPVL